MYLYLSIWECLYYSMTTIFNNYYLTINWCRGGSNLVNNDWFPHNTLLSHVNMYLGSNVMKISLVHMRLISYCMNFSFFLWGTLDKYAVITLRIKIWARHHVWQLQKWDTSYTIGMTNRTCYWVYELYRRHTLYVHKGLICRYNKTI